MRARPKPEGLLTFENPHVCNVLEVSDEGNALALFKSWYRSARLIAYSGRCVSFTVALHAHGTDCDHEVKARP